MIASEVPEAKFQQHLNAATKESPSLPLTCATQQQSVEKMLRNYLRIKYMHQCIFCMTTLCCFLVTALVEMSCSTPGVQHT